MPQDTTSRRRALDEAIEGRQKRKKNVSVSGRKNRVVARFKAERINPEFAARARLGQTTDSNN